VVLKWFLYVQLASLGSCRYILHRTECDYNVVMLYCAPPLSIYISCVWKIFFSTVGCDRNVSTFSCGASLWVEHRNRLSFIVANVKAALELDVFIPTLAHWSRLDSKAAGCKLHSYVWFQKMLNTLWTGLLNCLNARSRRLTFGHRASCI